ncbi:Calcineurin-like phosphoesterase [uncultured archaeon]|nr:Calcineurin-like phosphoesterase [uncultured archaeon]
MKIVFVGDVHGKTDQYQKKLRQKYKGQRTFQLGDMGFGFPGTPGLHKDIMESGDHKWIRGNHDDPDACRSKIGYAGDYGYWPDDRLFFLGGAYSIDKMWRVPGRSWWAGEELSYTELQAAIDLYKEVKPKYVATHEAPSDAGKYMLMQLMVGFRADKLECSMSRTAEALQVMFDFYRPQEWVFGHYHADKSFDWNGTKFTCVNELSCYTISDEPFLAPLSNAGKTVDGITYVIPEGTSIRIIDNE